MSNIVALKSFPFDSIKQLNEESGQMEDDRLYEAEIFRKYFAKFLSNGVYFGHYKNYGENSMKVSLDTGLTIKVTKGAGIIEGADYELENDTLFIMERPTNGTRKDRIVVKFDNTLGTRETQLYVKQGNGTTPANLQRDENIYEICIAEVIVKSTSNIVASDIKDTRIDKTLCGIVNSLISIDGKEMYEKFQQYIDTIASNLVRKDKDSVIEGKLIVKNGVEADLLARELSNEDLNNIRKEGFYYASGGNTLKNKPSGVDALGMLCMRVAGSPYVQIVVTTNKIYRRHFSNSIWTAWSVNYDELNPQVISSISPDILSKAVPVSKGGTGLTSISNIKINCTRVSDVNGSIELIYNPLIRMCMLYVSTAHYEPINTSGSKVVGNIPKTYRLEHDTWGMCDVGEIIIRPSGNIEVFIEDDKLPVAFITGQVIWFI